MSFNCVYTYYVGVDNLRVAQVAPTKITVMWNDALSPTTRCGPVIFYDVTIVNLMDPSEMMTVERRDNVTGFYNLRSNTSYNISVAAVNRAGTGPSSVITVTTLTATGM